MSIISQIFSLIGYYKTWSGTPVLPQVLVTCLFHTQQCVSAHPNLLSIPPHPAFLFGNCEFFLCLWAYFCLVSEFTCMTFSDSS